MGIAFQVASHSSLVSTRIKHTGIRNAHLHHVGHIAYVWMLNGKYFLNGTAVSCWHPETRTTFYYQFIPSIRPRAVVQLVHTYCSFSPWLIF